MLIYFSKNITFEAQVTHKTTVRPIKRKLSMNIFSGNSLWQLVYQSDTVSKCVLLILFGMSVACWAVFIGKLALLLIKERQFKDMNKKAQKTKTITDLVDITATARNTAPGYFISKNLAFLKELA